MNLIPLTLVLSATGVSSDAGDSATSSSDEASDVGATAQEEKPRKGAGKAKRFFYLKPIVGFTYADGGAVDNDGDGLLPSEAARTQSAGANLGLATGFKLLIFDLGLRGTYGLYQDFGLGAIMLDVGGRVPTPSVEPFLRAGVGYGWMNLTGDLGELIDAPDGVVADVGGGFDVWVGKRMTVGFDGALGFYFLSRAAIECIVGRDICDILSENGDAVAVQLRLQLTVGFWL